MARQALTDEIVKVIASMTQDYKGRYTTWLSEREGVLGSMTTAVAHVMEEPNRASDTEVRKLLNAVRSQSGVMTAYIGYEDGRFIEDAGWVPPAGYDPRSRPWYKKAKEINGVAYSEVYEDANTKKMVVSITRPLVMQGKLIGVTGVDIDLEEILKITASAKLGQTGYAFLIDNKAGYISHPTLKSTDNMLTIQNGSFKQIGEKFLAGKDTFQTFTFNGVERFYASTTLPKAGWVVIAAVPTSELYGGVNDLGMITLLIGLISVLILGSIIWRVASSISRPVKAVAIMAEAIAQGELTVKQDIQYNQKDEIGMLVRDMTTMQDNLRRMVTQTSETANQLAAASEELSASSDESAQATNHIAHSISEVASGSGKQVSAISETSAVTEQLSAAVQQVAATAISVAAAASETAKAAGEGNQAANAAVSRMASVQESVTDSARVVARLGERSKEIGQIVDTISGIAGQTNLLALNAAIEAARAGEQGRGFAVVAEEVRKLAEQSQEAAKQIGKLISEVQQETNNAVTAMNTGADEVRSGSQMVITTGQAFENISKLVGRVSNQIKEISTAIEEMASGSQRVVFAMKDVDSVCKDTAAHAETVSAATEEQLASMEEISSSSHNLSKLAQDLQQLVQRFKI